MVNGDVRVALYFNEHAGGKSKREAWASVGRNVLGSQSLLVSGWLHTALGDDKGWHEI